MHSVKSEVFKREDEGGSAYGIGHNSVVTPLMPIMRQQQQQHVAWAAGSSREEQAQQQGGASFKCNMGFGFGRPDDLILT